MNFSSNLLHWAYWLIGAGLAGTVLFYVASAADKFILKSRNERGLLYWLKRIAAQLTLTSLSIAILLFAPVSCNNEPLGCHTEYDNRGAHNACE